MGENQDTIAILKRTEEFIEYAAQDNSHGHKIHALEVFSELQPMFKAVYDPQIVYGVRPKSVLKYKQQHGMDFFNNYDSLKALLDDLADRTLSGHAALEAVLAFINAYGYEDLILRILDRNLKVRIKAKLVSQVYPGLFQFMNVALAQEYKDYKHRVDFSTQGWWMSRKLDGLRCIAIVDKDGHTEFFSRRGKKFLGGMEILAEEIKRLQFRDCVLDGEVCIVDLETGVEDFAAALSEFRSEGHIENPRYYLFDYLTMGEFEKGEGTALLSERLHHIHRVVGKSDYLKFVPQVRAENEQHMLTSYEQALSYGWEGIMLRLDAGWKGKRSWELLKVKPTEEAEFEITGYEFGPIRHVVNGQDVEEEMLSCIKINYKGYEVSVGSGFSMEERQLYYSQPELLDGATATVKYTSESKDKDGNLSLRFPRVKAIWKGERDV